MKAGTPWMLYAAACATSVRTASAVEGSRPASTSSSNERSSSAPMLAQHVVIADVLAMQPVRAQHGIVERGARPFCSACFIA